VAARYKAWVCGRSLAGVGGFKSRRGRGYLPLVNVMCFQVEVSATVRSLIQKIPTECGVSECDPEASVMRSLWPTRGFCAMGWGGG
jgi:hypothetical protein